ncbi:T9SS type A sorting domain-containing protein [Dokdonia sp.]|uniref:T9SS type A sorting domain-containing protein n=1 Tax=Dokdonia sp. TaxID=2024995 RepID=UPI003266FA7D
MRQFILFIGFLFSFFVGFGQCPPGNVIFTSQAQIDAFPINFPDCTTISFPNNVTISGADIVDLTPLSQIISIDDNLTIDNNSQLVSLEGLENLADIGNNLVISNNPMVSSLNGLGGFGFSSVQIINNDALVNLEGLEELIESFSIVVEDNDLLQSLSGLDNYSIGGENTIRNNISLSSLDGLNALSSVENLIIEDNPMLTDISSLENLQQIVVLFEIINNDLLVNLDGLQTAGATFEASAGFIISDNDALVDISALSDFETPSQFIEVTNNPNLSDCRIALLCNNIADTDLITIANNAPGCGTVEEVAEDCSLCSSGNVILTSQAEVDEFGLNSLSCFIIEGQLQISGDDITDLSPLSGITSVIEGVIIRDNVNLVTLTGLEINQTAGDVQILNNPSLENLQGLEGLTSMEDMLVIRDNAALTSLSGLNNLTHTDDLSIINNDSLEDLIGLGSLTSTDGDLSIEDNDSLENLGGLMNYNGGDALSIVNNIALTSMDGIGAFGTLALSIRNNPSMVDILSLNQVENIGEILEIVNNDNLTSLEGLENLNSVGFGFTISGNETLIDITALSELLDPSMYVVITNNPNLSVCDIEVVCSFISNLEPSQDISINNNATNCNSVEEVEEQCLLGIEEEFLESSIKLYPNPTTRILNIALPSEIELQAIDVFSVTGKKVYTTQDVIIDFSSLAKGMYFARVTTSKGVITKKIVKK